MNFPFHHPCFSVPPCTMWDELMEKIVHLLKCENEAEEAGHLGYAAMIRLEREKTVRSWDELLSHLKGW